MKNIRIILVINFLLILNLLIMTSVIGAQPENKVVSKLVKKNFIHSLNHEIDAIVEGTIFNLLLLKNKYPQNDHKEFINELVDLTAKGRTARIKYKAQLAVWYLTNFESIGKIDFPESEKQDFYFIELANKLNKNLIAFE